MTIGKRAFKQLFSVALFAGLALTGGIQSAAANELDNESTVINEQAARAKDLPGTVIVRVNDATGEASVLEKSERLAASTDVAAVIANADFKSVSATGNMSELDRSSSSSSWYAWYNYGYYYQPTYYYWGYQYSYTSYYSYNWYGYSYYWYRW